MALVNPNIAMSFRQPEFKPRNALAEYAQIQQIMGGQRQAEVADIQLEDLRRERGVLGQIAAAISAKGGPDLQTASLLMMKNPKTSEQGYNIYQALQKQKRLEDYERQYGGDNAAPAASMAAPAAAAPATNVPAPAVEGMFSPPSAATVEAERQQGRLARINQMAAAGVTLDAAAPGLPAPAANALTPTNALAPAAAAPVTNAMAAAAPDVNALMRRYNLASRAGSPDAAVILKQVEAALRGDQNRPMAVSQGQVVIDPRTGRQIFSAPETTKLSDRFVPVGRLVFDRQTQQYISPTQAQLAQSQERAATAAAPGGKPPVGYRFTPGGDLEPIPGGPAARAAEPKPLTPAQEIKRRDTLGKEFKSATSALQTTQDVLDSISFVKSEPGLSRATGFTGMLPSFPEGAAASAETRLANLRGKITALGKAAAASTGAIGSIANQEWKILADQIAAIDPVKGKGPLLDQLALVETQAQGAMARIQDAYQRQFGEDFERFPQFSNLPSPKSSFTPRTPATAPNLSPQEQTELDQLRQRFKGR